MTIRDYTYQHPWLSKIISFFILFPTIFGSLWTFFDPLDPFGFKILERFGEWGYVALLIVSFLISAIAVIYFIEKPRKTLPKIETELRKEECDKKELRPEFFREAGPYWIDFEKEYVHRRDEVDEIINRLINEPKQVVEGKPASGKSVLLKYIGFVLKNSGYKVFYIDCRYQQEQKVETYLKEALEIDDAKTLIIVDDYHQQIDNCEYFLKQYLNQGIRKTKILIGSRSITNHIKTSLFDDLDSTELEAIDLAEELISLFLNKVRNVTGETRVKKASRELKRFKHNLWHLSYALQAYDISAERVSVEGIHLHINNWITTIGVVKDKPINAGDVFLPLCTFYRFEFPVERKFLTKTLMIEEALINKLVSLTDITEIKKERGRWDRFILPHSSLASLYFETYQSRDFPDLGDNVKDVIIEHSNTDDWEEGLFQLYLTTDFTNRLGLIEHLAEYWELAEYHDDYWEDSERLQALFRKLIQNETVQILIKAEIEIEDEQGFMDRTYSLLTSTAVFLDLELSLELATTCVAPKLENKDLDYIVFYVNGLIEHTHARLLIPFVELILSKIETAQDIETVGQLISEMTDPTEIPDRDDLVEVGFELAPKVVDSIAARIEKENDLREIEMFLDQTEMFIGLSTAERVASKIDIDALISKIEQESNLEKIRSCIENIEGLGEDIATDIRCRLKPTLRTALELRKEEERGCHDIGQI